MNKPEKTFKNIFLNKNWIITETTRAIQVYSPNQYFNKKDKNVNTGIWFSNQIAFPSKYFPKYIVIGIDFEREYQIVTTYRNSDKIETETIKGRDLYQQFEEVKETISKKFFSAHTNAILNINENKESNNKNLDKKK